MSREAHTAAALLPCPFCGGFGRLDRKTGVTGTAVKSRWLREQIVCRSCGVATSAKKRPGDAAAAWNSRAAIHSATGEG